MGAAALFAAAVFALNELNDDLYAVDGTNGNTTKINPDNQITSIDLSVAPIAAKTEATHGAPLPTTWTGAASAANY